MPPPAGFAALGLFLTLTVPAQAQGPNAGDRCEPPSTVNATQFRDCRVVVTDAAELCRCRILPGLAPDVVSAKTLGGPARTSAPAFPPSGSRQAAH